MHAPRARARAAGRGIACALSALLALAVAAPARAIDNPDTPDLVAAFHARCETYEHAERHDAQTTRDIVDAQARYGRFLQAELDRAYADLLAQLHGAQREALQRAQQRWLAYREAELRFVGANWTTGRFGTSSAISRGDYRNQLLKDRTAQLLRYRMNYPP
ncbi:MAG: DUF1311 domain-containing protein [Betaproteobacteria bacterium]|nr:DUF1311 domain-containing protein [Betaproteobacteria bacterium]MDE2047378.1 DUF1311 domain-containing protein [Betaproteobacteria bacterium]